MMAERAGFSTNTNIRYPVSYNLKLIMDNSTSSENHKNNISDVLLNLQIKFGEFQHKLSTKKTYVSFTVKVRIISADQFRVLYAELRKLPGIKTAL
ncbi:MAG: DUF493 domain-containing protein [Bacteroidetes bacterium]|nr:DUF493 domain-containing protein [Bacteroidota bacterium]